MSFVHVMVFIYKVLVHHDNLYLEHVLIVVTEISLSSQIMTVYSWYKMAVYVADDIIHQINVYPWIIKLLVKVSIPSVMSYLEKIERSYLIHKLKNNQN